MSEHSLAAVSAATISKVPPHFNKQSAIVSSETYESDKNFFTSFNKEDWIIDSDPSEGVRWSQGPTHTYDSCFLLPDVVTHKNGKTEEKLNVLLDDNMLQKTSLILSPLPSDIKHLVNENGKLYISECSGAENVNVLPVVEDGSGKPVSKVKKKGKKVVAKRTSSKANHEVVSAVVSQKAAEQTTKKKKASSKKLKQNLSPKEMLNVLEEDTKVLEPTKDSTIKPQPSVKSKKLLKKHKVQKKDEENKYFKEVRRRGREASFNQSLAAYISVCVSIINV